jgi:hypothetical protein
MTSLCQEADMSFIRSVLACAFLATLLLGCKKADAPPVPALNSPSASVAAPSSTLPPSDAAIAPATPSASDSNAGGPTQASPSELSKEQESSVMPLPGQVNNHSTANPDEKK